MEKHTPSAEIAQPSGSVQEALDAVKATWELGPCWTRAERDARLAALITAVTQEVEQRLQEEIARLREDAVNMTRTINQNATAAVIIAEDRARLAQKLEAAEAQLSALSRPVADDVERVRVLKEMHIQFTAAWPCFPPLEKSGLSCEAIRDALSASIAALSRSSVPTPQGETNEEQ